MVQNVAEPLAIRSVPRSEYTQNEVHDSRFISAFRGRVWAYGESAKRFVDFLGYPIPRASE